MENLVRKTFRHVVRVLFFRIDFLNLYLSVLNRLPKVMVLHREVLWARGKSLIWSDGERGSVVLINCGFECGGDGGVHFYDGKCLFHHFPKGNDHPHTL